MSDEINNGGPAFPNPGHDNGPGNYRGHPAEGMTLRDYFAAQAMQGDIASMSPHQCPAEYSDNIAVRAYRVADAMLKARAEGGAA